MFASTRQLGALRVLNPSHEDVTADFLEARGNHLVLHRPVTPAMYTTDRDVIRQDCLCYFMELMSESID